MTAHTIVFTPSGLGGEVEHGTTVLEAARLLGADLDTVCAGRGICGRCQVLPGIGSFAKWGIDVGPDALGPVTTTETGYHGKRSMLPGHRLGCAATICGDVVVDVPASSQRHRQVVRKDLDLAPITVDASFALRYIVVPKMELGDPGDDLTALGAIGRALRDQHGDQAVLGNLTAPFRMLARMQPALDRDGGRVTVAIDESGALAAIWPGFVDAVYGVAVDIGSTTIAAHLCDLTSGEVVASAGRMNPQIRFGEDLMSRVSYVMMNPGGDRQLTEAVRTALDELIQELLSTVSAQTTKNVVVADTVEAASLVLEVVLVGNPIMHHIVLGIDPTPLGQAPFTLAVNTPVITDAHDLGLSLPNARVYVGPCIAGHVGADTTAAILAEGPHRGEDWQLLVDVGTNAEIVLGCADRQYAASSPTGPAFEGAQISSGQRATAGAIEGVRIDPHTLEPSLKVIGSEGWSSEPDHVTGICGSGIIDVVAEMYLAGIIDQDGVVQGSLADRSPRIVSDGRTFAYVLWGDALDEQHRVAITQNDVRAIQLAKAALRAGIDLLIGHAGNPTVTDIRLAGAFGAHIDPLHALVLGLVPDCPLDGVRAVGNAAGTGAVQALLSRTLRSEMERAARDVVKIETATEPAFQELFVGAMAFPHATTPTPHLAQLVTLPERAERNDGSGRGRRRRNRQETTT